MSETFFDTSTSPLDEDDLPSEERHIQNFSRYMLRGRLFMGIFHEKRYVEALNAYRDVVSVSKNERDLIRDLVVVKNRIQNYYSKNHWTGITTPDTVGAPANHCVWVELPQDQVFGCYWFKIKTVKFKAREAFLRLQVLRSVDTAGHSSAVHSKTDQQNISSDDTTPEFHLNSFDAKQYFLNNFKYFINDVATVHNIKEIVIFVFVMLITAVTGSFQLLQFLGDFLLKFMREVSNFIHTTTPIFMACINLIGKSISGLYMLIAYMWRDRGRSTPMHNNYYTDSYNPKLLYYKQGPVYYRRALPPPKKSRGVVITEVS